MRREPGPRRHPRHRLPLPTTHHSDTHRIFRAGEHRDVMSRVPGACWMVAGELGLRVDERFRWWYSDDDLEMQARQHAPVGVIAGTGLVSGPDSYLSEEKAIWAAEDRLADNLRTEAADPNNGWRENETYRASKIHAALKERARELRGGTHD